MAGGSVQNSDFFFFFWIYIFFFSEYIFFSEYVYSYISENKFILWMYIFFWLYLLFSKKPTIYSQEKKLYSQTFNSTVTSVMAMLPSVYIKLNYSRILWFLVTMCQHVTLLFNSRRKSFVASFVAWT